MSAQSSRSEEKIDLPTASTSKQKLELRDELEFCRPHLMALKSPTLEKLERMHRETQVKLQENREKQSRKVE